jgi:hypothetical protein
MSRALEALQRLESAIEYAELAIEGRMSRLQRAEERTRVAVMQRDLAEYNREPRSQAGVVGDAAESPSARAAGGTPGDGMGTVAWSGDASAAPGGDAVQADDTGRPLYRQWWFWTIAGAVFVGGVAAGVALAGQDEVQPFASDDVGGAILTLGAWQ